MYGAVKLCHRALALSERSASGSAHTASNNATVTQNVAFSTDRLMNSGYATPPRSHSHSLCETWSRMINSTAAKRKITNEKSNCPGMKLMFHISAMPPGINASHGLRHRKIAHDDAYVPSHVTTSTSTMNGSVSSLIPPCVAADHQSYIRSTSASVRTKTEPPGMTAISCRKTSVAPVSSAIGWSSNSCSLIREMRYPASKPENPIG